MFQCVWKDALMDFDKRIVKNWDLLSCEIEEDGTAFRMRLLTDCAKEIQGLRHRLKSSAK